MKKAYGWGVAALVGIGILVVGLRALRQGPPPPPPAAETPAETGLTLRDVTLEQVDDGGNLVWRVEAPVVTYSADRRTAKIETPSGEFYQDGELLYEVEALAGEIREDGNFIFLEGDIWAKGVQSQVELRGQALEWHPGGGLLVVQQDVTGTHPQLQAQAQEVRVYDPEQRMELEGEVVATTVVADPRVEPWLKLQGEALQWRWVAEMVESTGPLRVERFLAEAITEAVQGERGGMDLARSQVTLEGGTVTQLVTLPLTVLSDRLVWNVEQEEILLDQPLQMTYPPQAVALQAASGRLDLGTETMFLNRGVVVQSQRNDGVLRSDRLTWNLGDQTVLAEGNVDYRQGNPTLRVRGPRALGRIEAQTVVISGAGGSGQVVTEIAAP